ncbi:hypothetical protein H5A20_02180 [Pectobacterium brasiliense]|uniref:hypothetical protein n=1 Tax=Pectobacterium brasiliense TaxID=180957 RepID=UPI001968A957|nr:hypothetical protein [Pectobacterium brasiliense]MBN3197512.1 hypothetical protein [Pectobacterium brasiliense]
MPRYTVIEINIKKTLLTEHPKEEQSIIYFILDTYTHEIVGSGHASKEKIDSDCLGKNEEEEERIKKLQSHFNLKFHEGNYLKAELLCDKNTDVEDEKLENEIIEKIIEKIIQKLNEAHTKQPKIKF